MTWDHKTHSAITCARLMASSPEEVFRALQDYSLHLRTDSMAVSDKTLETRLLGRSDPLINLALAQYGAVEAVQKQLYVQASSGTGDGIYNKAIRLACLSNETAPQAMMWGPLGAIEPAELHRLARAGDEDELRALLQNQAAAGLLSALYQGKSPFDIPLDERARRMILLSVANPCVNQDTSTEHGPDMDAWGIQKGIYRLLQSCPAEAAWLLTLHTLLNSLDPRRAGLPDGDPSETLKRWKAVRVSESSRDGELREGYYTGLPVGEEFQCATAALYGCYSGDGKVIYLGSAEDSDRVLRCAHYGSASLTPAMIQLAYHRDADVFVYAALFNENVYNSPECRAAIEDCLRGDLRFVYHQRCKLVHRRNPSFNVRPVSEAGLSILDDLIDTTPPADPTALPRIERTLIALEVALVKFKRGMTVAVIIVILAIVLRRWL
jgi:hypothetical protein